MKATIWCLDLCYDTMFAKRLLRERGYEIEERIIDDLIAMRSSVKNPPHDLTAGKHTRLDLMAEMPATYQEMNVSPQIFLDGVYIGGYQELKKHFSK
jgi:glutaredoxin